MALKEWVRLPSAWIENDGLKKLRWGAAKGGGSSNTAALMALMALAHHADDQEGIVRLTYDEMCIVSGLSRAKLSGGLSVLSDNFVIERKPANRSTYRLVDFDPKIGWAKLPAKALYSGGRIVAFDDFKLRSPTELNALKLYFLFVARRGRDTNMANISYEKIQDYTGIERNRIKSALSVLAIYNLAHIERTPSQTNNYGVANAYRLIGLEPHNHMGTRGRSLEAVDSNDLSVK